MFGIHPGDKQTCCSFASAGCMFGICTVLIWAFMEMKRVCRAVSAWQLGPRMERASRLNASS